MSKRELELVNRIDELTSLLWDLNMKDRWTSRDYQIDSEWTKEQHRLGEELRALRAAQAA